MLRNLVRIFFTESLFRHVFAHSRVQLAQLRPLADFIALFVKIFGGLDCSASRGRPDRQGFQFSIRVSLLDHRLPFRFPVSQQTLGHLSRIIFSLR